MLDETADLFYTADRGNTQPLRVGCLSLTQTDAPRNGVRGCPVLQNNRTIRECSGVTIVRIDSENQGKFKCVDLASLHSAQGVLGRACSFEGHAQTHGRSGITVLQGLGKHSPLGVYSPASWAGEEPKVIWISYSPGSRSGF